VKIGRMPGIKMASIYLFLFAELVLEVKIQVKIFFFIYKTLKNGRSGLFTSFFKVARVSAYLNFPFA